MTPRTATWIAVFMCLCGPVAAQDTVAPEVVTTRFAWPVGTLATVSTYSRSVRTGGGTDADIVIEGSYDFGVEAHPDGVLVRHSNVVTTNFTSVPELPPDNPIRLLYSRLGGVTPNYVVSPAGELLRVDGVDEMRARMMEVLSPILDSIPDQAQILTGLLEQLTSTDALFGQMAEQWNLMVGFWAGAELELEALYEVEDQGPSPLIPGEMIPFVYQFGVAEKVPCTSESTSSSCVRIEFLSLPDPDVVGDMIERWVAQLGPDAAVQIESLDQENAVTLVTDPTTLLPYRWEMSRVTDMVGTEGAARSESVRSEETVLVFTYR